MSTPEQMRERAAEAERLAGMVAYERDRARLTRQAEDWRTRADVLEATSPNLAPAAPPPGRPSLLERLRRAFGRSTP